MPRITRKEIRDLLNKEKDRFVIATAVKALGFLGDEHDIENISRYLNGFWNEIVKFLNKFIK